MDISMPEMDGYQASIAIRNFEQEKKIFGPDRVYIVALSAH